MLAVKENLIAYFIYIHDCWHEEINSFVSLDVAFKIMFWSMYWIQEFIPLNVCHQNNMTLFFSVTKSFLSDMFLVFLYVIFTVVEEKQATLYLPTHLPI